MQPAADSLSSGKPAMLAAWNWLATAGCPTTTARMTNACSPCDPLAAQVGSKCPATWKLAQLAANLLAGKMRAQSRVRQLDVAGVGSRWSRDNLLQTGPAIARTRSSSSTHQPSPSPRPSPSSSPFLAASLLVCGDACAQGEQSLARPSPVTK